MNPYRYVQTVLIAGLLLVLNQAAALTPPPPQPADHLLPQLYEAFNGDEWHNNDGWLNPDVHWCDWYGVTCGDEFWPGLFDFAALELPDNNLQGELTGELAELLLLEQAPEQRLDLSGNAISGSLPFLPVTIEAVDLSNNRLAGPLPELPDDAGTVRLNDLRLSRNDFHGNVPDSWQSLALTGLHLADNELTGTIDVAVDAMSLDVTIHLDLAGNQFSGPLPDPLLALTPFPLDGTLPGRYWNPWVGASPPGLNLCWNDFDPPEDELAEFIDLHHHAGSFADCQRTRQSIDPTFSGAWFHPERAGEGFVQHLLDNGQVLLYWFTFPRNHAGGQRWHMGLAPAEEQSVWLENLYAFDGHFGSGREPDLPEHQPTPFRLSISRLESQRQHIGYSRSIIVGVPSLTGWVSLGLTSLRHDQVPLTRLAGSTCDNQRPEQVLSGAWFNPERDGEGFLVEANEDGRGVVFWFTYTADGTGQQAWMLGEGEFEHAPVVLPGQPGFVLEIDSMVQPIGTVFGSDFDSEAIELNDWGGLTLRFNDDLSGEIEYESNLPEYGSGSYPIERLARTMLAECGDE